MKALKTSFESSERIRAVMERERENEIQYLCSRELS